MSGDIEYGKCDMCGKHGHVIRKYYYYGIHCECCGSPHGHFEIVTHCKDCTPKPPYRINIIMKPIREID